MNRAVSPRIGNLHIQINPLSYENALRAWFDEAHVKEIRLEQYLPRGRASDIADTLGENRAQLIIKPTRKMKSFGLLSEFRRSARENQRPMWFKRWAQIVRK